MDRQPKSVNYYLLSKDLHPDPPKGFRQTLVNLLINRNTTKERDKFLLVQEKGKHWGLPKQGLEGKNLAEGFFETLVANFGEELGFKGMKIIELKPKFTQFAYFFNFDKQVYDEDRSVQEAAKGRPDKGKLYHLTIVHYKGPDELPVEIDDHDSKILDYVWATEEEARDLMEKHKDVTESNPNPESRTTNFHLALFERVMKANRLIDILYQDKNPFQQYLL